VRPLADVASIDQKHGLRVPARQHVRHGLHQHAAAQALLIAYGAQVDALAGGPAPVKGALYGPRFVQPARVGRQLAGQPHVAPGLQDGERVAQDRDVRRDPLEHLAGIRRHAHGLEARLERGRIQIAHAIVHIGAQQQHQIGLVEQLGLAAGGADHAQVGLPGLIDGATVPDGDHHRRGRLA